MRERAAPLPTKNPPGILGEIVARKIDDLATLAEPRLDAGTRASPPRDFASALRAVDSGPPRLIAEIKPRSPSRGRLADPDDLGALAGRAEAYERAGAAAVSVLCDGPYFDGSLRLLQVIRESINRPVLCKDFIVSAHQISRAAAAGADAVLLMASVLAPSSLQTLLQVADQHGLAALVEVHDEAELAEALAAGATIVGVNSRDLRTLKIDLARGAALLDQVPSDLVRVAESGVSSADDVRMLTGRADAALVGTSLMTSADPAAEIASMGFARCS